MTHEENSLAAAKLQERLFSIKQRADSVLKTYNDSPTYAINDSKGSVKGYKYFLYPFKNFSATDPRDEKFIAEHLAVFIKKDVDFLITFEADGIGITKLISVATGIPMLVCKPFHYNQPVIPFQQRTGYFERTMYCPEIIEGKRIAIVDCIVSTGGTIQGILEAFKKQKIDVDVRGIYAVVNKTNYQMNTDLFGGLEYRYLFNVVVNDEDKVVSAISDDFRDAFWREVNTDIMKFARDLAKQSDKSRNDFEVGAVLIDGVSFEILGWGFKGAARHAEDNALIMARENYSLKGRLINLYTTLEPCVYRNIEGMKPCSLLIEETPEIRWVVIDQRDAEDDKNHHEGIAALKKADKFVVCFEDHPSVALNPSPILAKQTKFSGEY
jgi:adenine phosphoribosyltransferase